jgi:hypothetical protein
MRRIVVSDPAAEFAKMKALHSGAVLLKEGGNPLVLLPKFSFRAGNRDETMDLLLHPSIHSGYVSRLFFERQVGGKGANWTQHRVGERNWWAPSWKDVKPNLPWTAMLCEHLRAVA